MMIPHTTDDVKLYLAMLECEKLKVEAWCAQNMCTPDCDFTIKHDYAFNFEIVGDMLDVFTSCKSLPYRLIPNTSLTIQSKTLETFDNILYYCDSDKSFGSPNLIFDGCDKLDFTQFITDKHVNFNIKNKSNLKIQSLNHLEFGTLYTECNTQHVHDVSNYVEIDAVIVCINPMQKINNMCHVLLLSNVHFFSVLVDPSRDKDYMIYTRSEKIKINEIIEKYFKISLQTRKEYIMDMMIEFSDNVLDVN